jgi:colanic acid/amylovoran biosynthesis glycosyltransferase
MRIAYLINLERRGVEIARIALRGSDAKIVDEEDVLERKRTRYVLRDGALP